MNRKKVVNGMLLVLALLLVVGMAVQFTPAAGSLGSLFNRGPQGTPALTVNGSTVTVEELEAARRGNPVLSSTDTGLLGDDFKTFVVSRVAQQTLVKNAVKDVNISRADVNAEVTKVREANNLTDNKAWTDALQGIGQTDASYREIVRADLAQRRKVEELRKAAPTATDAEARQFYDLNAERFQSDARIVGRQIVLTDEKKAQALLAQARAGGAGGAGGDFAALASANSTDATTKARGGALGPIENGAPRPVAQVALPTVVGAAAFSFRGPGLTDVIPDGGKFYIVKVEKYVPPAPKPFADAKADVISAVNDQKKNAAVENWIDGLRKDMKIEFKDPNWKVEDPTVATVAGRNILYSDVIEQVVNNQQFAALLQQVPAEQAVQLVNSILKPQVTQQLIQGFAAPTVAKNLGLNVAGSRQDIAAALAAYGARDVKVTQADLEGYYAQNKTQFETPASASVDEASFKDQQKALAFRNTWNGAGPFTLAATKAGGTVSERGAVTAGDGKLGEELNAAVFTAKTLRDAGEGSLSDVVKVGERYSILYVRDLKPAVTKSLNEVRAQIEPTVLGSKKEQAGQLFVTQEVAKLKPVDKLEEVLAAQAKRVAAATPKTEAPAEGGAAGSGASGTAPADTAPKDTAPAGADTAPTETAPADSAPAGTEETAPAER